MIPIINKQLILTVEKKKKIFISIKKQKNKNFKMCNLLFKYGENCQTTWEQQYGGWYLGVTVTVGVIAFVALIYTVWKIVTELKIFKGLTFILIWACISFFGRCFCFWF